MTRSSPRSNSLAFEVAATLLCSRSSHVGLFHPQQSRAAIHECGSGCGVLRRNSPMLAFPLSLTPQLRAVTACNSNAIERALRGLIKAQGSGALGERAFVVALLRVESDLAIPHGFVLTASNTLDDWTVILLRPVGASRPCLALEFLPRTGEFRAAGTPSPRR
jgi:hypothetical protein